MTRAVADRYVAALADVVTEPDAELSPEETLAQLQAFHDLLTESSELEAVLQCPAIQPTDKRTLIAAVGARIGLARIIRNFVQIVVEHRRIAHFYLLLQGFSAWLDAHRGRIQVDVRLAFRIEDNQKAALERRLAELTGKQVQVSYALDPALLGGAVVRIGSMLYDGSLRSGLGALAAGLVKER